MAHYKYNRFNHINPYCRYLTLTTSDSLSLLQPDKLKRFDLSGFALVHNAMRILRNNPQLMHLSWLRPTGPGAPRAYFDTLESLFTQLQTLAIGDRWMCRPEELSRNIRKNPGLKRLDLVFCRGLEASHGCMAMPSVTRLNLKSSWSENPGATQLIQHLPNLEDLTIVLDPHCPFVKVSEILRGTCIQVTVLRIKQFFAVMNLPDMIGTLVRSVPKLLCLELQVKALAKGLCPQLLEVYSGWLHTVNLSVWDNTMENLSSVNKFLASCPMLERFSLRIWNRSIAPMKKWGPITFWSLFKEPWKCPRLESLDLSGFLDPSGSFRETFEYPFLKNLAEYGWTIGKASQGHPTTPPPNFIVVEKVLFQVNNKPQLKSFKVNHIDFVRIKAE